ncbi:hypothetical protein BFG52_05500 [Acinetobacter larvae]|uniref:Tetratricopeptide repeat protein n=2 Tax=Acinetobacter larvae TaxID=1789224 RepID=A0A1B2LY45_9GAMM|nr:hypothetical protein BFG52_05500 [Acinetobacter larvae]
MKRHNKLILTTSALLSLALAGCQQQQVLTPPVQPSPPTANEVPKVLKPSAGVEITPYPTTEIERKPAPPTPAPVIVKPKVLVNPSSSQKFDDGSNLPVVKQMLIQAKAAAQQGQWDKVEENALHAQRLAPQSAETFLYLAMVANQRQQASQAEALARRGLSYAQSNAVQKQLWQVLLKSGQLQNKAALVQEAQQHL